MVDVSLHDLDGLRSRDMGDGSSMLHVTGDGIRADADFSITRTSAVTAYAVNQALGDAGGGVNKGCLFKFSNFFQVAGGRAYFAGMWLRMSLAGITVPSGISIRANIYNATPNPVPAADYANFAMMLANEQFRQGHVDFSNFISGGTGSDMISCPGSPSVQAPWLLQAAPLARDLYVTLVATAAFTPPASAVLLPTIAAGYE